MVIYPVKMVISPLKMVSYPIKIVIFPLKILDWFVVGQIEAFPWDFTHPLIQWDDPRIPRIPRRP
jgi:hypothetical protein